MIGAPVSRWLSSRIKVARFGFAAFVVAVAIYILLR